jgi:hypothetical protein
MAPTPVTTPRATILWRGGDVLQLKREHDLQRRLGRHPHAQAGQGEADDPADPDVLGRFGQRERLHVRLTDHLIRHDTSAAKESATGAARIRRGFVTLAGS